MFIWIVGYPYGLLLPFSKKNILLENIEGLKKLINAAPNNFMAYFELGSKYIDLKDYHKALAIFKKADELQPVDALVKYNLGYVHQCAKNYGEAKKYYQKYVDINPQALGTKENLVVSYENLAHAYKDSNNKNKANELFKKSYELVCEKNISLDEEVKQFVVQLKEFIDS